jgi:hypothetical protein
VSPGLHFPVCQVRRLKNTICWVHLSVTSEKAQEGWDNQRTCFCMHRLNLNKSRLLTRATKGFLSKSLPKASEATPGSQSSDYIPLVSSRTQPPSPQLSPCPCPLLFPGKDLSTQNSPELSRTPPTPPKWPPRQRELPGVPTCSVGISHKKLLYTRYPCLGTVLQYPCVCFQFIKASRDVLPR